MTDYDFAAIEAVQKLLNAVPVPLDIYGYYEFSEAALMTLAGHDDRGQELFTRERIFWLMDEKSGWLSR